MISLFLALAIGCTPELVTYEAGDTQYCYERISRESRSVPAGEYKLVFSWEAPDGSERTTEFVYVSKGETISLPLLKGFKLSITATNIKTKKVYRWYEYTDQRPSAPVFTLAQGRAS